MYSTTPKNTIPLLIFTYNRPNYLKRTLDNIFQYIPRDNYTIFVSQDGNHQDVRNMILNLNLINLFYLLKLVFTFMNILFKFLYWNMQIKRKFII